MAIRPKTLQAFTPHERQLAHQLLASKVALMMGRKLEEGDWAAAYCRAKGIPLSGWSNLNIDVMHGLLGVEHKMLCVKDVADIREFCGKALMHPAATRSIRIASTEGDPTGAAREVLGQYAELIERRAKQVSERAGGGTPDMRTGWLLWQDSLRQFLYFEEEMLPPNPADFTAEWRRSGGGGRKESKNLWVYDKHGTKRYSITTSAGAKIQPYFDVPPPSDPNLVTFTVQGERVDGTSIRIWLTKSTAERLRQLLGGLEAERISDAIISSAGTLAAARQPGSTEEDLAFPVSVTEEAYDALQEVLPGLGDEAMFRTFIEYQEP